MEAKHILQGRQLGVAYLRLLPKRSGLLDIITPITPLGGFGSSADPLIPFLSALQSCVTYLLI